MALTPPADSERPRNQFARRHALIKALPGYPMCQYFESLNRASLVFSGNSAELATHVGAFIGVPVMQSKLGEQYEHELVRLFHNYRDCPGFG